jgi:Spy/CpxP family protein refolding chaperone
MATKKNILTVSAVIAAMVFGNLCQKAYGVEEPNAPAEKQKKVEKRHRSEHRTGRSDRAGQRMAELSERLNLTDEQKDAIRPVIEKEIKDIQALRADSALSKEEKIEKMKAVRQATQEEIKNVLTPEQQGKLTEAKAEMKEEAKENIGQIVQLRMAAMSERLELTDEQKQKIQPILENEMKEMSAARDDGTLSREQKQEKMKTIRQTAREEINKVLTPEQKAKLEERKSPGQPRRARRRIADGNDKN